MRIFDQKGLAPVIAVLTIAAFCPPEYDSCKDKTNSFDTLAVPPGGWFTIDT